MRFSAIRRSGKSYDRGEIDAHGNPRPGYTPRPEPRAEPNPEAETHRENGSNGRTQRTRNGQRTARMPTARARVRLFAARSSARSAAGRRATEDKSRVEDLFSEFFGERSAGARRPSPGKGLDSHYDLAVTFEEAALGGTRRVKLPAGKRFDVKVPIGVREGQTIRLRGLGEPGIPGGQAGDALITITIEPHPYYRREGRDIHLDLPITLNEALHGAKVKVPTLQRPGDDGHSAGRECGAAVPLEGQRHSRPIRSIRRAINSSRCRSCCPIKPIRT